MYTLFFKIELWVDMETEQFYIAQAIFSFRTTFFSHLVGPCEQFGTHENLFWEWGAG